MKITLVCAVFPPEPAPAGVMAHQLATRLASDGHDVTMVVPVPNRPEGVVYPGFEKRSGSRTVTREGYTIVHCANWLIGRQRRNLDRILENITFGLTSARAMWRASRPDLIIIETWPLLAIQFVATLAKCWKVPYIYYCQDVYPEAAEHSGVISPDGKLARFLRAWDSRLCSESASVIAISDGMKRVLSAGRKMAPEKVTVIENWVDNAEFPNSRGDFTWRRSQGIGDDSFVAVFAGTLGKISGVDILLDVARLLQEQRDVLLLCIGEGSSKHAMTHEASVQGLTNIRFLPFQQRDLVPSALSSCNVALLTMCSNYSNTSVPSKLVTYFAASLPVVCAASPESAVSRSVRDADAGICVSPDDPQAIADAILTLKGDTMTRLRMGQNARNHFEVHNTFEQAYVRICAVAATSITNRMD